MSIVVVARVARWLESIGAARAVARAPTRNGHRRSGKGRADKNQPQFKGRPNRLAADAPRRPGRCLLWLASSTNSRWPPASWRAAEISTRQLESLKLSTGARL